jgi:protein gp37
MSDGSAIEWTDATWNPVRGCTKISPGCKHCYAETFAERFRGVPHDRLVARFRDAVDEYAGGAGADDIPKYVRNLHRIERDFLSATETEIELPGWIE